MRNVEIQEKLFIEYLTPKNVLAYVHEKRTKKIHQQYIKFSLPNSVQKQQYVKNEIAGIIIRYRFYRWVR